MTAPCALAVPSPEAVRRLRAVTVLERVADEPARSLLRELATGAAGDRLTRDAAAALERVRRPAAVKQLPVALRTRRQVAGQLLGPALPKND